MSGIITTEMIFNKLQEHAHKHTRANCKYCEAFSKIIDVCITVTEDFQQNLIK